MEEKKKTLLYNYNYLFQAEKENRKLQMLEKYKMYKFMK